MAGGHGQFMILSPSAARLPAGKHQLMAGYIRLNFRKGVNRLTIERWGLADVALKKCTFLEWYEERMRFDFRPFRYSMQEIDFDGEDAIEVTGRRYGIKGMLKSASELLRGKALQYFLMLVLGFAKNQTRYTRSKPCTRGESKYSMK